MDSLPDKEPSLSDSAVFSFLNLGEFGRPSLSELSHRETSHANEIPDVRAMLAREPRFSELNLEINRAYVKMAELFQDIYDPDRMLSPSWYGFAPYASRQAGKSIQLTERLTAALEGSAIQPSHTLEVEEELQREFPDPQEREMASYALSMLGPNSPGDEPNLSAVGDVRHLAIAARRLLTIVRKDSGPIHERVARVSRTVRNMLEDGNRAIVSEIGVAGQDYLHFRSARRPSPNEVLEGFSVEGSPANPDQAKAVFAKIEQVVGSADPILTEWNELFPPEKFDRSNFLVAAFAAYEAARLEPDPKLKNRWIEQAGVVMAFREQHDIVQKAFEDEEGRDEVSRRELVQLVTPWIEVPTRSATWTFKRYASENLPPADDSVWTPRASEYSWGDFPTRWGGILNFFSGVFTNPNALWPMPSPDPHEPLAGTSYSPANR